MSQRLRLNPIACEAHGMCGELLPERVTLDEWGYPIVDERPLDASLIENARRAAAACPTFALLLERGPTRRGAAAPCGCPRPGASGTGGREAALPNRSSALLAVAEQVHVDQQRAARDDLQQLAGAWRGPARADSTALGGAAR